VKDWTLFVAITPLNLALLSPCRLVTSTLLVVCPPRFSCPLEKADFLFLTALIAPVRAPTVSAKPLSEILLIEIML